MALAWVMLASPKFSEANFSEHRKIIFGVAFFLSEIRWTAFSRGIQSLRLPIKFEGQAAASVALFHAAFRKPERNLFLLYAPTKKAGIKAFPSGRIQGGVFLKRQGCANILYFLSMNQEFKALHFCAVQP